MDKDNIKLILIVVYFVVLVLSFVDAIGITTKILLVIDYLSIS